MLSLPQPVQIYVAVQPADLRRSFDGLAAHVRDWLGQDPLSGHLFVFRNQHGDRVKILFWDRDGMALYYKKQEQDCPHSFVFTEFGGCTHNLVSWPAAAFGMASSPLVHRPRRFPMSQDTAVAPPRAQRSSDNGRSISFGAG